jgi:hypothetical protein
MNSEKKEYQIEFTTPMLGTCPKNQEIYKNYISDKALKKYPEREEEILTESEFVENAEEKGWTGFLKDENGLYIQDHMIKGFLKAAFETCMENGQIDKIPAYKKWLDVLVFVSPRKIYFNKQEPDEVIERPLRAMTAQGPRVTLTRSDSINEGTKINFTIEVLNNKKKINIDSIETALSFGEYVGLGQWRGSGGYGRFKVL